MVRLSSLLGLTNTSLLISSMWDVKEPTHYSKRVGHEVPGVVAVLSEWVQCCTAHLNIINRKCAI